MNYISLLNTVVTLFLLLAAGFFCRKKGLIDDGFSKKLSTLIVQLGQPMLIISSLLSLEYTAQNLKKGLIILGLSIGLHAFMGVAAYLTSRPFRDADERKIAEFATVFTNCGFIGFPILESLYGKDGLFCGAFYLIGFHLFIWTWGMFILSRGRDDIKLTPKKIFFNFGTVPSVIGLVLFVLPFRLPDFAGRFASYLAALCTPVSMLITGALLATGSLKKLFLNKGNYYAAFLKLIFMPALVCFALKALGLDSFYVVFGTVMAAMPSASIVTMFGEMYNINPGYASRLVGLTSILCTFTLPLAVMLGEFAAKL